DRPAQIEEPGVTMRCRVLCRYAYAVPGELNWAVLSGKIPHSITGYACEKVKLKATWKAVLTDCPALTDSSYMLTARHSLRARSTWSSDGALTAFARMTSRDTSAPENVEICTVSTMAGAAT